MNSFLVDVTNNVNIVFVNDNALTVGNLKNSASFENLNSSDSSSTDGGEGDPNNVMVDDANKEEENEIPSKAAEQQLSSACVVVLHKMDIRK